MSYMSVSLGEESSMSAPPKAHLCLAILNKLASAVGAQIRKAQKQILKIAGPEFSGDIFAAGDVFVAALGKSIAFLSSTSKDAPTPSSPNL